VPLSLMPPALPYSAAAAPSTPLGPFADSAVAWTTWTTLMGFVGLVALALLAVGPAAARTAPGAVPAVTARLGRAAVVVGLLAVPAVLTELAQGASSSGGYDYSAAWNSLYDGSSDGRLSGLGVTFSLVGAALTMPLTVRSVAAGRARRWLLGAALAAGVVALGSAKFPGAVPAAERGAFWSAAVRRFSVCAMGSVAAITLSGLFLYWEHVDGPTQLLTTMYGRVLGVKILIFGALLLGMFNQFWLHPRIEALRAEGDQRPLRTVLLRRFPLVVAVEVLLGLALLFVAPFLHGSARNQAYRARVAEDSAAAVLPAERLPKLVPKQATASTWVWGTLETIAVVGLMGGGYRYSGRLARRRAAAAGAGAAPDHVPGRALLRARDITEA